MILEVTASAWFTYGVLISQANGETGRYIAEQLQRGRTHLQESSAFGLSDALGKLFQLYQECKEPNWDGYDALPVSETTYFFAEQFMRSLPLGTSLPSFGAEPDGDLTIEWYHSPRRTLSISISPGGQLHYSALIGTSKTYGTEEFFGEVPCIIVELINRIRPA
jgi:hypothetical protein